MSYTKTQVMNIQKAINNLKTFRPKCGKLLENSVLDPNTQQALKEFVTACKHNKLMEFFENNYYNTFLILTFVIENNAMGNGTPLKNIFLYHRKDLQRLIWKAGVQYYLKPNHCDTAAELLLNSLKQFPKDMVFEEGSEIVLKIKALTKFERGIKDDLLFKTSHGRSFAKAWFH